MAPVGIYPTGAVALYGGAVLRRGDPAAGKIVSYWRCELLHFMRYGVESWACKRAIVSFRR